jgi:hypothetical protein
MPKVTLLSSYYALAKFKVKLIRNAIIINIKDIFLTKVIISLLEKLIFDLKIFLIKSIMSGNADVSI